MFFRLTFVALLSLYATAFAAAQQTPAPDVLLKQAAPLIEQRDFQAAYSQLWEAVQLYPDHPEINFQFGMAAFEIGRYEAAAAAFERVLIANPQALRARLELGRTLFQLKSYVLAREEFRKVLAANPPPQVAENIRRFMAVLDTEMSPHKFSGRIGVGLMYDSNVATSPSSDLVETTIGDFTLTADSLPQEDGAGVVQFMLNHFYDMGQQGGFIWQDTLSTYHTRYSTETDYDLDVFSIQTGLGHLTPQRQVNIPLTYDWIHLDNQTYARYLGVAPSYGRVLSENTNLTLTARLQKRKYPDQEDRDSRYWKLELTPRWLAKDGSQLFQGTAAYTHEQARESYESQEGWEFSLGFMQQLPLQITMYLQQSWSGTDYQKAQALFDDPREEDQRRTTLNLSKRFNPRLSLSLSGSYTRNHSNIGLYDYERTQVTLLTSYEF